MRSFTNWNKKTKLSMMNKDKQAQLMSDRGMGSRYSSTNILLWSSDRMKVPLHVTTMSPMNNFYFERASLKLHFP